MELINNHSIYLSSQQAEPFRQENKNYCIFVFAENGKCQDKLSKRNYPVSRQAKFNNNRYYFMG